MIFLKLGGSLITDKARPETPRLEVIRRLAEEIVQACEAKPKLRLLLGHGSGSFGHSAASRHKTHQGVATDAQWLGFLDVWNVARALHRMVTNALAAAGAHPMSFAPSASAVCEGGEVIEMAHEPLKRALDAGLIPVVYGDVAFDRSMGACILSTEAVFSFLAPRLVPDRVLLAGVEPGVLADYADKRSVLPTLDHGALATIRLEGAKDTDVTGGMASKVHQALDLACALPDAEVRIFSGMRTGLVKEALLGDSPGTLISCLDTP